MPAETAHEFGIEALRIGLSSETAQKAAARRYVFNRFEPIERFGLRFLNPVGVAAGFDKNGLVVNQLAALGFGFVEVGTVTLEPQQGNEKPRLFRLPDDEALINRLGFNNDGAAKVAERLRKLKQQCVIGVNIGKNKDVPNEEVLENYLAILDLVHSVADYIVVNISSPNTPDLRELQKPENLERLIEALQVRNKVRSFGGAPPEGGTPNEGRTPNTKPLLVKIAPDLSEGEIEAIVDICMRFEVAGIIAANTTTSRDGLKTNNVENFGSGGLSGRPLAKRSTGIISTIHRYSGGKMPIIGVGGIFNAADAFEKIAAGACLLQAYTGFVYSGPSFAYSVNKGLAEMLQNRGFGSIDEAVGCGQK